MPRKMHVDEVDTDESLVRRLIAGQFPQWTTLPIEPVPSAGTDNALYRLGADMVVRLPRTPEVVGGVDKDLRWMPKLAPLLPVSIPIPEEGQTCGYISLGMGHLPVARRREPEC